MRQLKVTNLALISLLGYMPLQPKFPDFERSWSSSDNVKSRQAIKGRANLSSFIGPLMSMTESSCPTRNISNSFFHVY
jgi:hypothetical protein